MVTASLTAGAPAEETEACIGLKDDIDLLEVLDNATLHPKMEIVQIVQTMQDYL